MRHKRNFRLCAVAALLGALVLGILPVLAQGGGDVTVVGGDDTGLRELIAYLARVYGPEIGSTAVQVGALPADLPFELPLPEDARIVGSVSTTQRQIPTQVTIMLGTALSPQAVIDFYGQVLTGDWHSLDQPGMGGGFIDHALSSTTFCYGDETLVNLSANALPDGTTDVRFYVQPGGPPAMCMDTLSTGYYEAAYALLPQLRTPEGVTLRGGVGGGGGGGGPGGQRSASTTAVLITAIPVGDLIELYNEQLAQAGWHHATTEAADGFAWSGWTITDADGVLWSGILTLTANPAAENEYYAYVLVEEAAGQ